MEWRRELFGHSVQRGTDRGSSVIPVSALLYLISTLIKTLTHGAGERTFWPQCVEKGGY